MSPQDENEIWIQLANLFFLDTEQPMEMYQQVAQQFRDRGISRAEAEKILIYEVAPIAGQNLGYLLYPVIGEWAAFDKKSMCRKIRDYVERRRRRPTWPYFLQDLLSRRMVRKLERGRFYSLL